MEINNRLLSLLNSVIGKQGTVSKNNELMYECPFCDTSKKKLQINVSTQQWHCWVCDAKGRLVYTLLKKLKAAKSAFQELNQIYKNTSFRSKKEESFIVKLPEEFMPLTEFKDSITFMHARNYLEKRGITDDDVIRYNIGYCAEGEYKDRIIVPSYDENGLLNYFVARSFYNKTFLKYKNPPAPKDTVIFDLYVNWNMPIVLCEGVFDAIAIKRNAIPLLGKTVQDALLQKMINKHVTEVTVILDSDAKDTIVKVCEKLMRHNVNVSTVMLEDGDPSDLGYKTMLYAIDKRTVMTEYDLIRQRII